MADQTAAELADKYDSLMTAVECVLMDHLDELGGPNVDANLAELGYAWQQLTAHGGPNEINAALALDLDAPGEPVPELVDLFRRPRVTPPAETEEG